MRLVGSPPRGHLGTATRSDRPTEPAAARQRVWQNAHSTRTRNAAGADATAVCLACLWWLIPLLLSRPHRSFHPTWR